jgi:hypothetical protein
VEKCGVFWLSPCNRAHTVSQSLAGETVLAGYAARHLEHMLSLSEDDAGFQRKVQKQLKVGYI